MNLTDFYYDFNVGEYIEDEIKIKQTTNVLNHLKEAGFNDIEIVDLIIKDFDNKNSLSFEDLPDNLWDNSLIERNKFYYHKELQILSKAPTWDKYYPFYREMKIRYIEKDIMIYFNKEFNINKDLVNESQELGSIKYLLDKYNVFKFVSSLDFILMLIDYNKANGQKAYKIYDICNKAMEFAEILEIDIKNSVIKNKNTVIWRE